MNILWIVNIIIPELAEKISYTKTNRGGWLTGAINRIRKENEINIAIATVYDGNQLKLYKIDNVQYYLIPGKKNIYDKKIEKYWMKINDEFKPDIVHIHGTEYPIGLSYIKIFGCENVIISIQGIVTIIERYIHGNISLYNILKSINIFNLKSNLFKIKKDFHLRSKIELEYLQYVKNIIGRTSWDRAVCWTINPRIKYFFCNETLRDSFYDKMWKYNKCNPHTIFLTSISSPIKGADMVFKALTIVLKHYPDTIIKIAGKDIIDIKELKNKIQISNYSNYVRNLIIKEKLQNNIIFLGDLTEERMAEEYLKANIYICPSSIENSSNSLGEAQLIGTPVIASYVGGTPDMIRHGISGYLYRYEDIEMLAYYICEIFYKKEDIEYMSINERIIAQERHDRDINYKTLINIYKRIISNE